MTNAKYFLFSILLMFSFINADAFTKDGNIVTINIPQKDAAYVKTVRLSVINDNIIRVEATPEHSIPKTQSLISVPQKPYTEYSFSEDNSSVKIKTKNVYAVVNKESGKITFYDKNGTQLLKESDNGKTFKGINVGGTKGYSWHALFDSPDGEAFYGLGQHQANEYNYKGKNEELFQYNTKVSVPFIMSNKNYGILWDSYSLCRFGNPDDYLQLNRAFTLYDKNGNKGGLTGTYTPVIGQNVVRTE